MSDGTLRATHAVNGMRLKTYKLEAKFGYFMIGRNPKADLEINTEIISRKHVIFKHERNKWYALHHGLNEVKINGEVIPKYPEKILLRDNDKLALGPNDEFLFELSLPCGSGLGDRSGSPAAEADATLVEGSTSELREKVEKLEDKMGRIRQKITDSEKSLEKKLTDKERHLRKIKKSLKLKDLVEEKVEEEYNKKYKSEAREQRQVREEIQTRKAQLTELKSDWDASRRELTKAEKIAGKAARMARKAAEVRLQKAEEAIAREQEKTEMAKTEMTAKIASKESEIARLKAELSQMTKEKEDKEAEAALTKKRQRPDSPTQAVKRAKCEQFNKVSEQLACPICNELLIKTNVLDCGHKFCQYCIEMWEHRSPSADLTCPSCRKSVTAFHPDFLVDNLIESLIKDLSVEEQADRAKVVEDRAKEVEELRKNPPPRRNDSDSELSLEGPLPPDYDSDVSDWDVHMSPNDDIASLGRMSSRSRTPSVQASSEGSYYFQSASDRSGSQSPSSWRDIRSPADHLRSPSSYRSRSGSPYGGPRAPPPPRSPTSTYDSLSDQQSSARYSDHSSPRYRGTSSSSSEDDGSDQDEDPDQRSEGSYHYDDDEDRSDRSSDRSDHEEEYNNDQSDQERLDSSHDYGDQQTDSSDRSVGGSDNDLDVQGDEDVSSQESYWSD